MIALTALTLALNMANPVNIATCSVDPIVTQTTYGDTFTPEIAGAELHISFVNTGREPISSVAFAVNQDGKTSTILDRGTFSPGVAISHYWSGDLEFKGVSCSVNSVLFADGTSWTNQSASGGMYGL